MARQAAARAVSREGYDARRHEADMICEVPECRDQVKARGACSDPHGGHCGEIQAQRLALEVSEHHAVGS